jgi:hypothetical protein
MIHAIDKALIPWMQLMVSLPTFLSQIALKFVLSENESKSSSAKPRTSKVDLVESSSSELSH